MMVETTILDQLQQRVRNSTMSLRTEMIVAGMALNLLSVEAITVEKTADGVLVKFIEKPKVKRPAKAEKAVDES